MAFKPTLAVNADLGKITYPVYASPKLDGIRCVILNGESVTRTLKPIQNTHIRAILSQPMFDGLDGELIIGSPTSPTCYATSVSGVMSRDGEPEFTFYVFDKHDAKGPFSERLLTLNAVHPCITVLEQRLIHNHDEMLAYEAECVSAGYEGLILRSPKAPYKHGRSTVNEGFLLKVKRFEDSEAEVIGFEEEQANYNVAKTNELGNMSRSTVKSGLVGKGSMGAILVRDVVTGVEFAVGSGLNADQRQSYWAARDVMLGKFIKYKYFPVGVKIAPRHPVFLGMRDATDFDLFQP